jgi:hypothetical protein
MPDKEEKLIPDGKTDCEVHSLSLPDKFSERYSPDRDPASEKDIARYVEIEARDENVQHVELVKTEFVLGDKYEIWDVVTDKGPLVGCHKPNQSVFTDTLSQSGLHAFISYWLNDAHPKPPLWA